MVAAIICFLTRSAVNVPTPGDFLKVLNIGVSSTESNHN